ncbi:MAG: hypothetical protein J7D61_08150, partial [Marichromatium sp.]|nr:hypothetical protein [Marichromatium sp.]
SDQRPATSDQRPATRRLNREGAKDAKMLDAQDSSTNAAHHWRLSADRWKLIRTAKGAKKERASSDQPPAASGCLSSSVGWKCTPTGGRQ